MSGDAVLVLGGGVGGVVAANRLRRKLGDEHRVILVDRERRHIFAPSLLWLAVGTRTPEAIGRDLGRLERKGIEMVTGEVESLDAEARTVRVGEREIDASHVVVSLGARLAPEAIPGLAEAGHNLYTLEGATAFRDQRTNVTSGKVIVLIAGVPFKCPAAPYEAAMLIQHDLRRRKLDGSVEVAVYTPEPGPMGVAGPEVSAGVRSLVEERGISYFPQHQVTEVDPEAKTITFANGVQDRFEMLVYVPPHTTPDVVKESALSNESGWVPVDRHTMETGHDGVYAIGDVTTIPLAMGLPLPKAGVFASGQAEAVADTIVYKITGRGQPATFDGEGQCFVEVGGRRAAYGKGNFYAEPNPVIQLRPPGLRWHIGKLLFEKGWFWRWL